MDSNTFFARLEVPAAVSIEPDSLYALFEHLPDGRQARGRRSSLALLLTLLILAKLAGQTTISGAAHWLRLRQAWLAQVLPLPRPGLPCSNTYSYALAKASPAHLTDLVQQFFARLVPSQPTAPSGLRHLAIDGKTLRGTVGPTKPKQQHLHLLSIYDVARGLVLAQQALQSKDNEISTLGPVLRQVPLHGCVLTADALHTQRPLCRQIIKQGGHYILLAKDNHSELRSDIALLFDDPDADQYAWQHYQRCGKGHGRREVRRLTTSPDLTAYLAPFWCGVRQVFRLERTIIAAGQARQEMVYGLTSLAPEQADPQRLEALVRAHWHIENRLHWRRDVTLGEDHCQARTGQTPQMLAALHNLVLALLDWLQIPNVAAQLRIYAAHPNAALALLLGKL